ncbi:hypothetical protein AAVH_32152 [Aphelenchoides avenae]|nr:hypothetical protein AAVH_32152 [Aphelenchus avenae]
MQICIHETAHWNSINKAGNVRRYHSAHRALHSTVNSFIALRFARQLRLRLLRGIDGTVDIAGPTAIVEANGNGVYAPAANYRTLRQPNPRSTLIAFAYEMLAFDGNPAIAERTAIVEPAAVDDYRSGGNCRHMFRIFTGWRPLHCRA